jgi:polyhydroxyalkanoate synthesis regulator phasin
MLTVLRRRLIHPVASPLSPVTCNLSPVTSLTSARRCATKGRTQEATMLVLLRKLLLAGLGTLDLTEEKARAIFNDLVARGELSEKDARELINTWTTRASEQQAKLQERIDAGVRRALDAVGLVKRAEHDALVARVAELEKRAAS